MGEAEHQLQAPHLSHPQRKSNSVVIGVRASTFNPESAVSSQIVCFFSVQDRDFSAEEHDFAVAFIKANPAEHEFDVAFVKAMAGENESEFAFMTARSMEDDFGAGFVKRKFVEKECGSAFVKAMLVEEAPAIGLQKADVAMSRCEEVIHRFNSRPEARLRKP